MDKNAAPERIELGGGYRLTLAGDGGLGSSVRLSHGGHVICFLRGMTLDRARHFASAMQPQVSEGG